MSVAAIEIIKRQKQGSEYVFDYGQGKPISELHYQWLKLKLDKKVTPHVLRHSFASLAGDIGLPDHTISRLLGHSQKSITSRYIHLERSLIVAANQVAAETMRLMRV